MEQTQNPLGSERIGRLLAKFAIPTVISLLVNSIYNIVDQIFIGWGVGTLGNSATNVVFPLVLFITAIAVMFGDGGAAYMSLSLGKGEKTKAQKGANTAIGLLVVAAIVLFVVLELILKNAMLFLGATPDNFEYAMSYGRIIIIGFPFVLVTVGMSSLIRADGSPHLTMIILLVGAVLNVILDAIFVLKFEMGMAGAAWATVIGQFVSLIICLWYIPRFKTIKIKINNMRPSAGLVSKIISLGVSSTIVIAAVAVVSALGNNLLRYYGTSSIYGADIPLAAFGIVIKVSSIFTAIMSGIAIGCNPIFGFNYGAENYARVKKTLNYAIKCALCVAIAGFIVAEIFPVAATNIFGKNGELYTEFSIKSFRVFNACIILNAFHIVLCIFFQAIGKPVQSIVNTLCRQIVIYIPVTLIFSATFAGLWGVVFAAPVADGVSFIIALFFIHAEMKKINSKENKKVAAGTVAIKPTKKGLVITIAREHGSAGKLIGQLVAQKMDIPCYYKEMIALAAQESGLAEEFISEINRHSPKIMHDLYLSSTPLQYAIIAQEKAIKAIADNGSCVIVSRAADYVLKDYSDVVRIFIHAPKEYRIKKVMDVYGDTEHEGSANIKKSDESRAAYYKNMSGLEWGFSQNYDLCIDSSIGEEKTANIIFDYVRNISGE